MTAIRRFAARDHGPVPPLSKYLQTALLNSVCWTTCLALPSILLHLGGLS